MTATLFETLLAALILLGALFVFIGSLGLARLADFYTRLHGPTKATTLGVGSLLLASMLHFSAQGEGLSLHEGLVTLFLFITAPVSAHLLAKAALHLRVRSLAEPPALLRQAEGWEDGAPASAVRETAAVRAVPEPATDGAPETVPAPAPALTPAAPRDAETAAMQRGAALILLTALHARFGPLPPAVRERVQHAPLEQLLDWAARAPGMTLGELLPGAEEAGPD